jgi:F-box and leucine-rich repeat protein 14
VAAHRRLESLGLWFCPKLGEQGTKAIGTLKDLRHLRAGYCPGVTDDRLDHWADLVDLRELDLRGTSITGAGGARLARFGRLEVLHLWACPNLTEECIPAVCGLRNLRVLEFYESPQVRPTDGDLAALAGLRHLRRFSVNRCERVTADGYRALAGLPGLEELGLRDCTGMTDADLKAMATGGRLKTLTLSMAGRVTDAGLTHLTTLPLRLLWIHGCEQITSDGVAAFKRARPRCDVDVRPDWKPAAPAKE